MLVLSIYYLGVICKMKLLEDWIQVKRLDATEQKTEGGLILAPSAQQLNDVFEVLAVGEGKKDDDGNLVPLKCKVGDKIVLTRYGGVEEYHVNGKQITLSRDSAIVLILTEE